MMSVEKSGNFEFEPEEIDLRPTVDFINATMQWATEQQDFPERDLVARSEVENESSNFPYHLGSRIVGDVQGIDAIDPNEPYIILKNVVHYTESDEFVVNVIAEH